MGQQVAQLHDRYMMMIMMMMMTHRKLYKPCGNDEVIKLVSPLHVKMHLL